MEPNRYTPMLDKEFTDDLKHFRRKCKTAPNESGQKIKSLEEKPKKDEEKNRVGNQGGTIQGAAIEGQNEELEKIKNKLGESGFTAVRKGTCFALGESLNGGTGHKKGRDD